MAAHPGWEALVTDAIARQARDGASQSAAAYIGALDDVNSFRWSMLDAMGHWDLVVTPASPALPWPRRQPGPATIGGQPAGPRAAAAFSTAVNLAGLPAIVVPAPVEPGHMPVGVQLIAKPLGETLLLDIAAQLERPYRFPPGLENDVTN